MRTRVRGSSGNVSVRSGGSIVLDTFPHGRTCAVTGGFVGAGEPRGRTQETLGAFEHSYSIWS